MSTEVVTLGRDATVGDAMSAFTEYECRHLPIMDDEGVVGVLSDRDLRRVEGLLANDVENPDGGAPVLAMPVMGLVSGTPITIAPGAGIDEAIDLLVNERVGALLVVDDEGALVGMLSYIDILEAARGRV